ncbi:MAG: 16S rRNA (guanine(527)-N(7))-methyltransferase RsmG, partial [Myxococcota bacterium]
APLARYVELVLEWRERVNLTGARTREALVDEHPADAWALLPWLPRKPFRFVDVGSGAGLPGVVLAVVRTDSQAVLLEPRQKRHAFLAHVLRELDLRARVEVRRERLEAHAPEPLYDVAVSRATWPAAEWLELGLRLVRRPGGRVLGLEGGTPSALPPGAVRHPYRLGERQRAVLIRDA